VSELRVIYHVAMCPDCGSSDVTREDVDTGDGLTETALTCPRCHTAWPLACVTDFPPSPSKAETT
jgi:ribosomal protein S27AE